MLTVTQLLNCCSGTCLRQRTARSRHSGKWSKICSSLLLSKNLVETLPKSCFWSIFKASVCPWCPWSCQGFEVSWLKHRGSCIFMVMLGGGGLCRSLAQRPTRVWTITSAGTRWAWLFVAKPGKPLQWKFAPEEAASGTELCCWHPLHVLSTHPALQTGGRCRRPHLSRCPWCQAVDHVCAGCSAGGCGPAPRWATLGAAVQKRGLDFGFKC